MGVNCPLDALGVGKTSGGMPSQLDLCVSTSLFLSVQKELPLRGAVLCRNGSTPLEMHLNPHSEEDVWVSNAFFPGNGSLDEDIRRYFLLSTDLTPLHLVNPGVLERHAGPRTRR